MQSVKLLEEHGHVLEHWICRPNRNQSVVCFDRHLDLKHIAASAISTTADNLGVPNAVGDLHRRVPFCESGSHTYGSDDFLYAAIQLGALNHFVWVVPRYGPKAMLAAAGELWAQLSLLPEAGGELLSSFVTSEWSARCKVGGALIEVTTPQSLHSVETTEDPIVDVDLDFFVTPRGGVQHTPNELREVLDRAGFRENLHSISFSESSGFLPPEFRSLCDALLSACSTEGVWVSTSRSEPERTLRHLALGSTIRGPDIAELWNFELNRCGGAGYSLRAVLEARVGRIPEAVASFEKAQAMGDRASWAAYSIGLASLQCERYAAAAEWFQRVNSRSCMGSHSLLLGVLCMCRLRRYEEAIESAKAVAASLPLRAEPLLLGAGAARHIGRKSQLVEFIDQLDERSRACPSWKTFSSL